MPQDNPPLLDKTMNTTESTPRNLADVLAEGLEDIANNVKPDASDITLDPITGMSANNVQLGISELKGTFDDLGTINNVVPYGNTPVVSIDKGGSSKIGKLAFVNIAFTVLSGASVGANTGIITVTGVPTLINNMALNLYDVNGNFITGKCRMSGTIIYAGASLTAGNSYNISGFYFTT